MKQIVYIPVYIDGKEENLPKEYSFYVFSFKNGTISRMNYYQNDEIDVLNNCNYWLKPIELPDEKEIENAAIIGMQREEGDIIEIIDSPYACAFIDGVRWFKSQILK